MEDGASGTKRLDEAIGRARDQLRMFATGLMSLGAAASLARAADQWSTLQGRLKLATQTQAEYNTAAEQTFAIAQRTNTGLEATVSLYGKLQGAVRGLGGTQQEALALTEAIGQSFTISGTAAGAASGAILQLGQALASGVLRGDEFNSVMEASPRLMQAIADGMGVPIGALRKMAEEGKLTADVVVQALLSQKDKLAAEYAQMPQTIGGAFQQLKNAFVRYVGDIDQATGASSKLASAIIALSQHFDVVAKAIGAVLVVLGGAWVARMAAAIGAAGGLVEVLGKLRGGLLGLAAFAGLDIFTSLTQQWEGFKQSLADQRAAEIAENRLRTIEMITRRVADGTASAADIQFLALLKGKQAWDEFTARLPFTADQLRLVEGAAKTLADQIDQRLSAAIASAGDVLKSLGEDGKISLQALQQGLQQQLAALDQHYAERRQLLENSQASERQQILEGANIEREAAAARMQAMREWAAQSEQVVSQVYGRMVELARAAGQDTADIERQGLDARLQIYGQLETAYRQTIDQMIAEEQRLLAAARAADEQRAMLKMSVEDRIRALRQKAMDDYAAYQDRLRQIDEKNAAARAALEQGNYQQAQRLAEQAMAIAERNATEVTRKVADGTKTVTQVLVSEQQAVETSAAKIAESYKIVDAALKGVADSSRAAAGNLDAGIGEASARMAQLRRDIEEIQAKREVAINLKVQGDMDAAAGLIRQIEQLRALKDVALTVQSNAQAVQRDLEALVKSTKDIDNQEAKLNVKADADSLRASLRELVAAVGQGKEYGIKLPAEVDMQVAEGTLLMLSKNMDQQLQNPRKVNLDPAEAEAILARLKQPSESTHAVRPDTGAAQAAIEALKQPTYSTHTVYVQTVQTRAMGGPILAFARGGMLPRFRRITPGPVHGPGTSTSDSIPAFLSAGEYVIRAASVRKYGQALLAAINQGLLPRDAIPRFAGGGFLGDAGRDVFSNLPDYLAIGPRNTSTPLNVTVQMPKDYVRVEASINGQRATLFGARDQANALANALRSLSRGLG
jgi:tape measure domain-containing protein